MDDTVEHSAVEHTVERTGAGSEVEHTVEHSAVEHTGSGCTDTSDTSAGHAHCHVADSLKGEGEDGTAAGHVHCHASDSLKGGW